jgi:hypothetical protein
MLASRASAQFRLAGVATRPPVSHLVPVQVSTCVTSGAWRAHRERLIFGSTKAGGAYSRLAKPRKMRVIDPRGQLEISQLSIHCWRRAGGRMKHASLLAHLELRNASLLRQWWRIGSCGGGLVWGNCLACSWMGAARLAALPLHRRGWQELQRIESPVPSMSWGWT